MTALTASSTGRPRGSVTERSRAETSSPTFFAIVFGRSSPPPPTGDAAPAFVPGAIAATSQDIRMRKPAEAACDPGGATQPTTGTGDAEDRPRDLARGVEPPARRVDAQDHEGRAGRPASLDRVRHEAGADGVDLGVEVRRRRHRRAAARGAAAASDAGEREDHGAGARRHYRFVLQRTVRWKPVDALTSLFAAALVVAGLAPLRALEDRGVLLRMGAGRGSSPRRSPCSARRNPNPSKNLQILFDYYVIACIVVIFDGLGPLIRAVNPVDKDAALIAFDRWLLGTDPTVALERFATPLLSDVLTVFYSLYYFHPIVLGTLVLLDDRAAPARRRATSPGTPS